jgi:protease-4
MRNWQFLLTSQIVRSAWFMSADYAYAAVPDLLRLFNPDAQKMTGSLDEIRGSLPLLASSLNGDESSSYDDLPGGSIANFKFSGVMLKHGTWCSYGTEEISAAMKAAASHKNIAGALVEMDSGGGGVNAVAPFLEGMNAFKAQGKPTLAHVDVCCSAALWGCAPADQIMASNNISALIGSIGVMQQWVDFSEYYEKMGINISNRYPAESSMKNKGYEDATKGNFDYLEKEELAPLAIQFQNGIKTLRGSKLNLQDENIMKGKVYSADQAVANGLIDTIGNREKAIEMLFDMIDVQNFLNSK